MGCVTCRDKAAGASKWTGLELNSCFNSPSVAATKLCWALSAFPLWDQSHRREEPERATHTEYSAPLLATRRQQSARRTSGKRARALATPWPPSNSLRSKPPDTGASHSGTYCSIGSYRACETEFAGQLSTFKPLWSPKPCPGSRRSQ